jgi:hypothetical protein
MRMPVTQLGADQSFPQSPEPFENLSAETMTYSRDVGPN